MATPRRTSTRRAVLSYSQLNDMVDWPELMKKDYQGILQDFTYTSDEIDDLELRVIENEEDIVDLQERVIELEGRIFRTIKVTENHTALPFQVVLCDNDSPIEVTLSTDAETDDLIHVTRRKEQVTTLGLIDGDNTGRIFNLQYQSELYIFDGEEWSAI